MADAFRPLLGRRSITVLTLFIASLVSLVTAWCESGGATSDWVGGILVLLYTVTLVTAEQMSKVRLQIDLSGVKAPVWIVHLN